MNRGFTLLEVIVAIFVIMVGITGTLGIIQQGISYTQLCSSRLTASYLAQEGIEIVRNIRDTNWLEGRTNPGISWSDGIPSGNCEADYNDSTLTSWSSQGRFLNIDLNNFYSYDISGSPTKFKRKISIAKDTDILKISVQVEWQERGKDYGVTIQENLYKWY